MKIGIVGQPSSGKTAIFKLLTSQINTVSTGKPLIWTMDIKDSRLDFLASIFNPKKLTYVKLELNDVPGFSKTGLALLQTMDALIYVIPFWGSFDKPLKYLSDLQAELILRDVEMCENGINKSESPKTSELLKKCKTALDESIPLSKVTLNEEEEKYLRGFGFLSQKPAIVILNTDNKNDKEITEFKNKNSLPLLILNASIELEILELDPSDRDTYCKEYGIDKPVIERFAEVSYAPFKLVIFFTVGEDEVRGWQVTKGMNAPQAAGKVHSDMERGFIKADVIGFEDFKKIVATVNSHAVAFKTAKGNGLLQVVDKDYIVKDGDIIDFKFNV
jgi:ribosome-binding ATPase